MRLNLIGVIILGGCSVAGNSAATGNVAAIEAAGGNGGKTGNAFATNTASAQPAAPAALTGTRPERLAQLLRNLANLGESRTWEQVRAAFPGARWERQSQVALDAANPRAQSGSIDLRGEEVDLSLRGTATRVGLINIGIGTRSMGSGNNDDEREKAWSEIEPRLRALGIRTEELAKRCNASADVRRIRLTGPSGSTILSYAHDSVGQGPWGGSETVEYTFDEGGEAQERLDLEENGSFCLSDD